MTPQEIQRLQTEAGEKAGGNTPSDLLKWMEKANAKFAAKGGCWGCGSQRIGVHHLPCAYCDAHPFD